MDRMVTTDIKPTRAIEPCNQDMLNLCGNRIRTPLSIQDTSLINLGHHSNFQGYNYMHKGCSSMTLF